VKSIHILQDKPFLYRLILYSGIILIISTSACGASQTQVPFLTPTPTYTITATFAPSKTPTPGITLPVTNTPTSEPTLPPTSTPDPNEMSAASPTFSITVRNPQEWNTHLFVDNVYILTVPALESVVYQGAPAGVHAVHFCQVQQILTCDPPQTVTISGDTEWIAGEPFPNSSTIGSTIINNQPAIPTPPMQSRRVHIIKINNHTPWEIYVYIENQIVIKPTETPSILDTPQVDKPKQEFTPFLTIPEATYRTFNGLTTGTYTFIHCYDKSMKRCFEEKTIMLDRDTEWHIYPR